MLRPPPPSIGELGYKMKIILDCLLCKVNSVILCSLDVYNGQGVT